MYPRFYVSSKNKKNITFFSSENYHIYRKITDLHGLVSVIAFSRNEAHNDSPVSGPLEFQIAIILFCDVN